MLQSPAWNVVEKTPPEDLAMDNPRMCGAGDAILNCLSTQSNASLFSTNQEEYQIKHLPKHQSEQR